MLIPFRDDNPVRATPVVTYAIVAVNVVAFLWLWRMPEPQQQLVVLERGFIPARIGQLKDPEPIEVKMGAVKTPRGPRDLVYRMDPEPRQIYSSLLTCMFLHGGWLHLISNMWFLWIFGNNVEDRLGPVVYALFYLGGGLLATAVQWWFDPTSTTPVIGASGAVAAILGAYAITWPWARVETFVVLVIFFTVIQLPALAVLGFWFVAQLVGAARSLHIGGQAVAMGVAWWAHIGGFLGGLMMMPILSGLFGGPQDRREPAAQHIID